MKETANKKSRPPRARERKRNRRNSYETELRAPAAPERPVVAGSLLHGGSFSFVEFLADEKCGVFCELLFEEQGTSAGTMLAELRSAVDFAAFYHGRPGKLRSNAQTKRLLKKFARRAYRGDPNRRGVVFWERVAWLLWNAYASLMALRARAEKIKRLEIKRIASLSTKRRTRAAYMRRYRAKGDNKRPAKSKVYYKTGAKEAWAQQRLETATVKRVGARAARA